MILNRFDATMRFAMNITSSLIQVNKPQNSLKQSPVKGVRHHPILWQITVNILNIATKTIFSIFHFLQWCALGALTLSEIEARRAMRKGESKKSFAEITRFCHARRQQTKKVRTIPPWLHSQLKSGKIKQHTRVKKWAYAGRDAAPRPVRRAFLIPLQNASPLFRSTLCNSPTFYGKY